MYECFPDYQYEDFEYDAFRFHISNKGFFSRHSVYMCRIVGLVKSGLGVLPVPVLFLVLVLRASRFIETKK